MSVQSADLDSVEVMESGKKFKFEENRKYRVGFPLVKENGKVRVDVVQHYEYNKSIKKRFIVPENEELKALCDAKMPGIKTHYVTIGCFYRTDSNGKITKPFEYQLAPFVLDNKKLSMLKQINEEFPLGEHDVMINCDDAKYQSVSITPTSKKALWLQKDTKKIRETALEMAKTMHQAVSILATDSQIREWLGLNDEIDDDDVVSDTTDESIADSVGDLLDE